MILQMYFLKKSLILYMLVQLHIDSFTNYGH